MAGKKIFIKLLIKKINISIDWRGSAKKIETFLGKAGNLIGFLVNRLLDCFSKLKYYTKIWFLMTKNSFLVTLSQKKLFFLFLFGKLIKFFMFLAFIYFILQKTNNLAGYTMTQTIFFFLTFNFVDIISQFLYRHVYSFRPLLVSGDFDLILSKPMNSLFRVLMGGTDAIDLVTIPPLIMALIYIGALLNPSILQVAGYIILLLNGLLIATAFHIAVAAFGVITLEIDHTIMIYRDLTDLGKFPVEIYREPVRSFLTFVVPVGIMITFPVKTLIGLTSVWGIVLSIIFGSMLLFLSIRFWNLALRHYTSASS